jgi:hypothetical protein
VRHSCASRTTERQSCSVDGAAVHRSSTELRRRGRTSHRLERPAWLPRSHRSGGRCVSASIRLSERSGVGVEPTYRWATPAWPILKTPAEDGRLQGLVDSCASVCVGSLIELSTSRRY